MSADANAQAPPRVPDTAGTVSDTFSLTNSILMILIGYLLWKMFGKSIGRSKLTLTLYSPSFKQMFHCQ